MAGLALGVLAGAPRGALAAGAAPASAGKAVKKPSLASAKPADRERARQLVLQGDRHYERGEYEQALQRYEQAYALMHVPTVGIEVIKAQTALGRLVEAQATAQEVASSPRQRGEPAVFEEARQRAVQSNLRLSGMIPSLWLEVSPSGVVFEVEIDGVTPPSSPPYRLNPGSHQVRIKASGYQTRELAITLREAERLNRRAELVAERGAPPAAVAVAPAPAGSNPKPTGANKANPPASTGPGATSAKDTPAKDTSSSATASSTRAPATPVAQTAGVEATLADTSTQPKRSGSVRSLGWVSLGVAAVAAGAGAYAGLRAFSMKPECPDDTCAPSQQDDIDASTRMGTIANVSVGIAVVTGALGIWALASGDDEAGASASLTELPVTVGLGKLKEIRISGHF